MSNLLKNLLGISFVLSLATILTLTFSSCKKEQETPKNQETTGAAGGLTLITEMPNVTSASAKASDVSKGMERFATKEAKDPIAFDVRGDKLENIFNDTKLGITFGSPREFQAVSFSSILKNDIARQFTEFASARLSVKPLYAYSNGRNTMVVSQIQLLAGQTPQEFIDEYETLNKTRFAPATLTLTSFKNRDIPMTQFFVQESESGLFRVVFPAQEDNRYIQFDYTIRRISIQEDMQRIEPSLGSIMRIAATNP